MSEPFVILGHGGHAQVVLDLLRRLDREVLGVLTPDLPAGAQWAGTPVLGEDNWLDTPEARACAVAIGVGQLPPDRTSLRPRLFQLARERNLSLPALVHPSAIVAGDTALGVGSQIMAGAVIQVASRIGDNALINTRASVDHHCRIGANVHIGPGATLCGEVQIDEGAFVGAGAVILQGLHIGAGAQIAAGATVIHNIPPRTRFIPGQPDKSI